MAPRRSLVTVLGYLAVVSTARCELEAASHKTPPAKSTTTAAHLEALSSYGVSLGTPIRGTGTGFPIDSGHRLQMVFKGEFRRSDGRVTPVSTAVDVEVQSEQEFLWTTFGPYAHPFTERGD